MTKEELNKILKLNSDLEELEGIFDSLGYTEHTIDLKIPCRTSIENRDFVENLLISAYSEMAKKFKERMSELEKEIENFKTE